MEGWKMKYHKPQMEFYELDCEIYTLGLSNEGDNPSSWDDWAEVDE